MYKGKVIRKHLKISQDNLIGIWRLKINTFDQNYPNYHINEMIWLMTKFLPRFLLYRLNSAR